MHVASVQLGQDEARVPWAGTSSFGLGRVHCPPLLHRFLKHHQYRFQAADVGRRYGSPGSYPISPGIIATPLLPSIVNAVGTSRSVSFPRTLRVPAPEFDMASRGSSIRTVPRANPTSSYARSEWRTRESSNLFTGNTSWLQVSSSAWEHFFSTMPGSSIVGPRCLQGHFRFQSSETFFNYRKRNRGTDSRNGARHTTTQSSPYGSDVILSWF